jgi:dienelactone hydrolase
MAAAGYFVVVPDLFHGDPVPDNALEKGFDFAPWIAKHGVDAVDPVITSTIKAMRENYGVKKIGAVGYCFGGRYVVRFLGKGKGLDAGFAAHPSMVQSSEFEEVDGPLSLALAGELIRFSLRSCRVQRARYAIIRIGADFVSFRN